MRKQFIIFGSSLGISISWFLFNGNGIVLACILGFCVAYLPMYFNGDEKKDGMIWPKFQHLLIWKRMSNYISGKICIEKDLDHKQQYIFCNFPHGACSVNHLLTATNACGMLSDIYTGPRRDLVASILFSIPILREFLLLLGCVDAAAKTAKLNLEAGRSLLIYIGGEKEQLMTTPGEHKIYLRNRKGFIKLALTHGAHLVPMYAFGENDCFHISDAFMETRIWLQETFKFGIPLAWGAYGLPLFPLPVPVSLEIGAPIVVKKMKADAITSKDINSLHEKFIKEMERLFERTKMKYPGCENKKLQIL